MAGELERSWLTTATIDWPGLGALGIFDKHTSPDADSDTTKYQPGGGEEQRSFGGRPTMDNLVITRYFSAERDRPLVAALHAARGKAPMTISLTPTDENDMPIGSPITYTGKFKRYTLPDGDSESNDVGMIELEQDTDGKISA